MMVNRKLVNVKKIAVLRANGLGDFIFILPALTALRETYPESEIVYLGRPWHRLFLAGRPGVIDRTVVVPVSDGLRQEPGRHEDQRETDAFFQKMQAESFDLAFQLHGGGRQSNPFIHKLGASLTVGLRTPDAAALDINVPYVYYQNEYMRYLEVVSRVGATSSQTRPVVSLTDKDAREIKEVADISSRFIVVHPGASDPRRRWPADRFAAVADFFAKRGFRVVITGIEDEMDVVREVQTRMTEPSENLAGKLTIRAMTGLLSAAALLISNDTGPYHLAYALDTPAVGVFWCANLINSAPLHRRRHRALASWTINCPMCGMNCAEEFPFEPKIGCDHLTSFTKGVKVAEVALTAIELLKADRTVKETRVEDTLLIPPAL